MKRILLLIISICMALAVTGSAFAHPGRTDSQGGHTDRSTGEYHYHHGYPAHQHEDRDGNGIKEYCPYNFNDKTGANSGTSSSRTTVTPATTPASVPKITIRATTPPATTAPVTRATTAAVYSSGGGGSYNLDGEDAGMIVLAAACLIFCIIGAAVQKSELKKEVQGARNFTDVVRRDAAQKEAVLAKQIQELTESLAKETEKTLQYEQDMKRAQEEFDARIARLHEIGNPEGEQSAEERILSLAQQIQDKDEKIKSLSAELDRHIQREKVPGDVFYADDGMPVLLKSVAKKYGDYSVYLNHYTGVYHGDQACAPYGAQEIHLFKVLQSPNTKPCMKCAKQLPIRVPDWWDARK